MINAESVIREVQEDASEYLEMVENPTDLVVGILANKVVKLTEYIVYLERRLKNDSSTRKVRIN